MGLFFFQPQIEFRTQKKLFPKQNTLHAILFVCVHNVVPDA